MDVADLKVKIGINGVSQVQRGLSQVDDSVKKTGNGFANIAKGIGSALALDQFRRFTLGAVDAASDLQESTNMVNQVFGKSAEGILKWAETSATSVGMAEGAALQAIGSFGAMFSSMGFGEQQAAGMSKQFVQLSADMASFWNMDPADMAQKIMAGLTGEAEPLKRLGINLTEAAVKAKAAEMGLAGVNGELTEQQKVLAREALIMEQTAQAQGDMARTSDQYANATRILKANLGNLRAEIGQLLLPMMTKLVAIALKGVEAFLALPGPIKQIAIALGLVLAAGLPLLTMLGLMLPALGLLSAPLLAVAAAIAALGIAIGFDLFGVRSKLKDIIDPIKEIGGLLGEAFATNGAGIDQLLDRLFGPEGFVSGIGPGSALEGAGSRLRELAEGALTVADALGDLWAAWDQGGWDGLRAAFGEELSQIAQGLGQIITPVVDFLVDTTVTITGEIWDLVEKGWEWFVGYAGFGGSNSMMGDNAWMLETGKEGKPFTTIDVLIGGAVKLTGDLADLQNAIIRELGLASSDAELVGAAAEGTRIGEDIGDEIMRGLFAGASNSAGKADAPPGFFDSFVRPFLPYSWGGTMEKSVYDEWNLKGIGIAYGIVTAISDGLSTGLASMSMLSGFGDQGVLGNIRSILREGFVDVVADALTELPDAIEGIVGVLEIVIDEPTLPKWIRDVATFTAPVLSFAEGLMLAGRALLDAWSFFNTALNKSHGKEEKEGGVDWSQADNTQAFMPWGMGLDAAGGYPGIPYGEQAPLNQPVRVELTPEYILKQDEAAYNQFLGQFSGGGGPLSTQIDPIDADVQAKLSPKFSWVDDSAWTDEQQKAKERFEGMAFTANPKVTVKPEVANPDWMSELGAGLGMGSGLAKGAAELLQVSVKIAAETTLFDTAHAAVMSSAEALASSTWTGTFDLDIGPFTTAYTSAWTGAEAWEAATFTSSFNADASQAWSQMSGIFAAGGNWANSVFTATFSIDTSPLFAALATTRAVAAEIAALLPNSPAKKGPLSRMPSFKYIADALESTMKRMPGIVRDGMRLPFDGVDVGRASGVMAGAGAAATGTAANVYYIIGSNVGRDADEWIRETASRESEKVTSTVYDRRTVRDGRW